MHVTRSALFGAILLLAGCGGGSSSAPVYVPVIAPAGLLTPSSTASSPLTISRTTPMMIQVNDTSGMTSPTSTNASCANGFPASSGSSSYSAISINAASGAPANCAAMITVNMTDGKTANEYVVVP
ncbi:MAG: hypothetical protein ABR584_03395 [Candidatus Baltobacteraceae bacterium]